MPKQLTRLITVEINLFLPHVSHGMFAKFANFVSPPITLATMWSICIAVFNRFTATVTTNRLRVNIVCYMFSIILSRFKVKEYKSFDWLLCVTNFKVEMYVHQPETDCQDMDLNLLYFLHVYNIFIVVYLCFVDHGSLM